VSKTLIRVTFQPDGRVARVEPGVTVMWAARQLGLHLNAPCGGRGVCGNCRVEISKGAPDPTDAEREHLSHDDLAQGWRLACQARLHRDAVVAVPESTGARDQKILTAGVEHDVPLRPNVLKQHVTLDAPSLADGRADADRLLDACRAAVGDDAGDARLSPRLVARLPALMRDADFDLTAVTVGRDITWIEPGDTTDGVYGIAADVGTTTVVGTLFDLTTGRQLAVASRTNPQTALGDDVVSRIHHASTARGGLKDLQRRVVRCLNEIVGELCRRARVRRRHIYEMTAAGNTTMNHLLLGIDPSHVAQAPYVAAMRAGAHRPSRDVGLRLSPGAILYTLPNIAGFVGGDTVGVILATDLQRDHGIRLAVDIGTNGEMVLASADGLVACSTAAGPAFEGARITHGMRASPGAIEGVRFDGDDLDLTTIDNEPARGLCGTGLIEAVSTLLDLGVIDETGRLRSPDEVPDVPERVAQRIVAGEKGREVVLAHGHAGVSSLPEEPPRKAAPPAPVRQPLRGVLAHAKVAGVPYDVRLTQRDVREVQLAKAAIAAGIQALLDEHGLAPDRIDEVLLAGGFGNHIDVHCAVRIGLLPDVPDDRITFVGNAAAEGARMVLLDRTLRDEAERISRSTRYLELAGRPDFQTAFTDALLFPA